MMKVSYKQMPKQVDRRVRRGVRFRFWRDVADQYVFGRSTFALGTAVLAVMFISSQYQFFELQRESRLYAQLLDHIADERARDQQAIVHVKMRVEEGRDKAAVVAKLSGLNRESAYSTPLRSEEVEFWTHSTNVMTVVRPYLPGQPAHAFMNLERDGHVHVFRHDPDRCSEGGFRSPGCKETTSLSDQDKARRSHFDSVHSIDADYRALLSVHTTPFEAIDQEPMVFDREEETTIVFSARVGEDLRREYVYKKTSLELVRVHTLLFLGEDWNEMSVMHIKSKERLAPEEFDEIFDPGAYPLKQTERIRLN